MKCTDDFETEEECKKTGKGFYIALAVCVIAICGVAVTAFVDTLPKDEPTPTHSITTPTVAVATKTAQQVLIPATNVKDTQTTTTSSMTVATSVTADKGPFVLPISNRVLREFSDTHYFSQTLGEWVTHNGVDFAGENAESVKAVADGVVTEVYCDALWGDVIELKHSGNVISRYCGAKATVTKGTSVKVGDVIGTLTSVPAEIMDQTHLHLEMLANDVYFDPLTLISGQTTK